MSKTFEQGKDDVSKLCQYFATNRQSFLAQGVKEAHIRQSLIDPFFEALGWDVRNASRIAPQYREVIPEDSLEVDGQQKAPDYTFRVGTLPKFYVEAKKCGVNINTDIAPAYQLRRYGFSANLALSLLTDFDELGIYDCASRPRPTDKASNGRIQYFGFAEYPDRWREIWDVFSREAVWSGGFDQYAASKRKKGTSEVDSEFLKDIEEWRDLLARNLALRNSMLTADDLNAAVQKIIDRLIFLRMAEDRKLEPDRQLLALCDRPDIYARFLSNVCRKADEKYNSGLFHFHDEKGVADVPDTLTPHLSVDDKVLKPILQSLYFENGCPYHFGVLPVEILGTVYERFLGKVIRLTAGHQAKVEEKPEVRKAGGVYYTPAYIVNYIVQNTIGKQIADKTPADLAGGKTTPPFRVLDMACGSGSFLLGAYQFLLDHCLKWYQANPVSKHAKAVYQNVKNETCLTIAERKRILITHIYGVDIDRQAVETTKLSLLLKALEGESDTTLSHQMTLFQERALPNLSDNIKCGNSLISSDFSMVPEDLVRVHAFDWPVHFPDAMKAGGFDAIIGNPPYVYGRDWAGLGIGDDQKTYFLANYSASPYQLDLFSLFMERAVRLTIQGGATSQIVPNVWLTNRFSKTTREYIFRQLGNIKLTAAPPDVFEGVVVDTVIYTGFKGGDNSTFELARITAKSLDPIGSFLCEDYSDGATPITLTTSKRAIELARKIIRAHASLGAIAEITRGVHPYRADGYGESAFRNGYQTQQDVDERPYHSTVCNPGWIPFVYGKDLQRIEPLIHREYIKYGPWLAEPRDPKFFSGPRIYSRKILGERLVVTYEERDNVADQQVYITKPTNQEYSAKFLVGVLGSKLVSFFIRAYFDECTKAFPQLKISQLREIPISKPSDRTRHDKLVSLVDKMLALTPKLRGAASEAEKAVLQSAVKTTDAEIDRLVYDLYGLTPDEIAIVEGQNV
jgi:hypothetical protein